MAAGVEVAAAGREVVDLDRLDDVRADPGALGELVDAQPDPHAGGGQLGTDDRVVGRLGDEVVDDQRVDWIPELGDRTDPAGLEDGRRRGGLELQVDAARTAQLAALRQGRATAAVRVVPVRVQRGVAEHGRGRVAGDLGPHGVPGVAQGYGGPGDRRGTSGSDSSDSVGRSGSGSGSSWCTASTSWLRPLATRDTIVPIPPSRLRRAGRSSSRLRQRSPRRLGRLGRRLRLHHADLGRVRSGRGLPVRDDRRGRSGLDLRLGPGARGPASARRRPVGRRVRGGLRLHLDLRRRCRLDDDHVGAALRQRGEPVGQLPALRRDLRRQTHGHGQRGAVHLLVQGGGPAAPGVEAVEGAGQAVRREHQPAVLEQAAARLHDDPVDGVPGQPAPLVAEPDPHTEVVGDQQRRARVDEVREVQRRDRRPSPGRAPSRAVRRWCRPATGRRSRWPTPRLRPGRPGRRCGVRRPGCRRRRDRR